MLGRDVLLHDPDFFKFVDQFAVEVHLSRYWLNKMDHLQSFALLLELLEEAKLELVDAELTGCSVEKEQTGLMSELEEAGFHRTIHCHNYLFARL
jgi:hypothetical protein